MNCSDVRKIIQLYMDNELDARNTLEALTHLETCSACSKLLEAYSEQDRLLRYFARTEATDNREVRERIADICNQPSRRLNRRLPPSLLRRVAAVTVIATVGALLLMRGSLPGLNEKVYAEAASDHAAHRTIEKLTTAITDSNELDRMVAEYGHLAKRPDLSAYGYSGLRAKVCPVTGGKILHLIFHDSEQKALSVFMRPHREVDQIGAQLRIKRESGYTVAAVSRSDIDVLVITSLDDNQTSMMLQAVVARM